MWWLEASRLGRAHCVLSRQEPTESDAASAMDPFASQELLLARGFRNLVQFSMFSKFAGTGKSLLFLTEATGFQEICARLYVREPAVSCLEGW